VHVFNDVKPGVVRSIVARAHERKPAFISEPEGHEILAAYGLPVPRFRLARNETEAIAAAGETGFPLVLKIVSPQILHKTDFGGVRVGIRDEAQLRSEHAALLAAVRTKAPDADIWGVLVQAMAPKGTETIIGMKRDRAFGPLLMFGLGGVLVEVLKDVVFRVAPLNDLSVESMVTGIKAYRILKGFRGEPARDIDKIKECLARLSQLVTDFPDFDEIDLNPLLVYAEGQGAMILDARLMLR
jgi:acyl-CoA synthetase (NDP forming)